MPCGRTWSAQCSRSEMKLNVREIEWKSLMNECLMGTEIFTKDENESETCSNVNPNSAMDVRHRMVKESTKIFSMPQIEAHSEALKLIRIKNYNRMLKQKEGKMVEKEIARLKETLENSRFLIQKKLNETTEKRTKPVSNGPKYVKCYAKSWKRLGLHDGVCEVDTWLSHFAEMTMKTSMNEYGIPFDVKVSLKRHDLLEESVEPAPSLERGLIKDGVDYVEQISEKDESKNEIIRMFLERSTKLVHKELTARKRDEKIREMQNKVNFRLIGHAWMTWKAYTQQHKSRNIGKKMYKRKIEAFLSKLQDKEKSEGKGNGNSKRETKIKSKLEDSSKVKEKQTINDEKDKHLEKLMEEVKSSRTEAYQKLQEISKATLGNQGEPSNLKFLQRIEERREERLRRRKEFIEKKLKLEEERKNAEKEKEDEKRRKEEENKRKKLEEAREKRRLEMEKKKEQEREREKLRQNVKLAEDHRRRYLLRSYGLRPWLKLIEIGESQGRQALAFYEGRLTRKTFDCLFSSAREQATWKMSRADEFHERLLKKNFFLLWLDFHKENLKQDQVAADWNEFKISERAFRKWLQFTQNEQIEYFNKVDLALVNYERKLKMKYLKKLRDYPELKKLEQAKENRKRKWRERVKEILPDYQPADSCTDFSTILV